MTGKRQEPRADLGNALWLMERMNARKEPITSKQVHYFGTHPAGPILPDNCVETRKLPDHYRSERLITDQAVWNLSVSPKGEPCIITKTGDMNVVVCGYTTHELIPDGLPPSSALGRVTLLGYSSDGLPITHVWHDITDCYSVGPYIIFRGSERILEDEGLFAASLFSNGDIISFSRNGDESNPKFKFCRNDEVLIPSTNFQCQKICEGEDGQILCITNEGKVYVLGEESPFNIFANIVDVVHTRLGVRLIDSRLGMYEICRDGPRRIEDNFPRGGHNYVSDFTEIGQSPRTSVAYIGKPLRDSTEFTCWVLNGQAQPNFDFVSPLFERDGHLMYYGVIGRHFCTMILV